MPESTVIKHLRDGTLTISSGASSYEIAFEQGNLSLTIPGPSVSSYLDRGRFSDPPSVRFNEDQPMTGSFSANFRDLSDPTYVTAAELVTKSGDILNFASTLGAGAEVQLLDLLWNIAGVVHNDPADHTALIRHCWLSGGISDGDPNIVNINFTGFDLYPTVT